MQLERLVERQEQRPGHFASRVRTSACSVTTSSSAARNAGRTWYLARYSATASLTMREMLRSVSAANRRRSSATSLSSCVANLTGGMTSGFMMIHESASQMLDGLVTETVAVRRGQAPSTWNDARRPLLPNTVRLVTWRMFPVRSIA